MKTSIRTIFGGIVVAALCHSLGVQGIRSAASLSSSSLDSNQSSRRKLLLNTRGGVSGSEPWTSEIPRESLPRALSGRFLENTKQNNRHCENLFSKGTKNLTTICAFHLFHIYVCLAVLLFKKYSQQFATF